ncbi:AI-2E family transporter [Clostridium sp. BJN0001]|uniref:AI-2E family transporter n=1 Tax=Clostridium sp. BJN0001 TaxID=2930219 RepID=UPI001FD16157|nr:AI-2E family transporter [Clostridium sp. BJN0001]
MKIEWNKKYTTISIYAFLVSCAVIIFFKCISEFEKLLDKISAALSILEPFIIGFAIAYILNFVLKFFENNIFSIGFIKKLNLNSKIKRCFSLFLTYIVTALLIFTFTKFMLPQLVSSIIGLVNDIPLYINESVKFTDKLLMNLNIQNEYLRILNGNFNEFINYIIKLGTNFIPIIGSVLGMIASSIWNIILGTIISMYLLIDKERFCALSKKIVCALFSKRISDKLLYIVNMTNDTFGNFIVGKILDSFIIGVLTFIVLTVTKMPYNLLIAVIIGITNIIPFFGPIIGAVPAIIIILFVSPIKALWFILIILIIQQLDGNVIGPKILGNSIGISAFWILFAILVTGKFLGIIGMIIGVPLFAVIYVLIKNEIEDRLRKKGLKIRTEDYIKNRNEAHSDDEN